MDNTILQTRDNSRLILNLAPNYGARTEIVDVVKAILIAHEAAHFERNPAQGREVRHHCRISTTGKGQLALFCWNCQVQRIRTQLHCQRCLSYQE